MMTRGAVSTASNADHHFGEQLVARAQIDLALVGLGPRLIEALLEIVTVEYDKIHDGLEGDANPLAFFHLPRVAAVYPDGSLMQGFHRSLPRDIAKVAVRRHRTQAGPHAAELFRQRFSSRLRQESRHEAEDIDRRDHHRRLAEAAEIRDQPARDQRTGP